MNTVSTITATAVIDTSVRQHPLQQCILIIAPHGSYRTMRYIQAAKQLGLDVMIASQGKHSIVSDYAQGLQINFDVPEQALTTIIRASSRQPFVAVLGTDDSVIELAANVASRLGLVHNSAQSALLARRKDLARQALQQNATPVPVFKRYRLTDLIQGIAAAMAFPLVIKPLSLSASRGVMRVDNPEQLQQAAKRLHDILQCEQTLEAEAREMCLLETYIHGDEIAVEGIVDGGEFKLLTVFDKPDPLHGPYFEETFYITPSRLPASMLKQVCSVVQSACQAYGVVTGPVHAECRINNGNIYLIEMAARTIGGLCSDVLEHSLGCSLEHIVLSQLIGLPLPQLQTDSAAGVLMIPIPKHGILRRVEGQLAAAKIPAIEEINIQIREGYELIPLPEGNSYLGFVFARAASIEQVEAALRKANETLKVIVAPLWNIKPNDNRQAGR